MNSDILSKVFEFVDKEELTAFLQKAIQIPSHIECPDQEKEVAEFIAGKMKAEGIETELQIVEGKRPNVLSTIRGDRNGKSVTFNGHIDSIPPFDMTEPFSGRIDGDQMYGRGTSDMKSGIIAMAYAMIAIKRSGYRPPGDVVLSAVVGEEYGSFGATHYVKHSKLTDYGVCGEPTGLKIATAQKGLHWFEFNVPGRRIHSSVSSQGINALKRLNQLMTLINEKLEPALKKRTHHLLGSSLVNLGKVWGGEQPNVVPGEAHLQIERRYIPGETLKSVMAELDDIVAECNKGYDGYPITYDSMPYSLLVTKTPMDIPVEHPVVQAALSAGKLVLGAKPEIFGAPFWGDAGVLSDAGVTTILFGPGEVSDAHTANEHVSLANVYKAAKIYAAMPFLLG
jgi:acetylornithine deacetylase/succinyl-diaminopimelate desuccinylase family protein